MSTKKPVTNRPVARELTPAEVDKLLAKIAKLLKAKREARSSLEAIAYELGMSRTQITRYESGGDMYLSTFLKLLHGLDEKPEDFFKELK